MAEANATGDVDARDVHVSIHADDITAFLAKERMIVCFRCGQTGHARYQCLSYKVRLCKHHALGRCTDPSCTFAHGAEEIRTPWKQRCIRVVKQQGRYVCMGCYSTDHTFRSCPIHKDMIIL